MKVYVIVLSSTVLDDHDRVLAVAESEQQASSFILSYMRDLDEADLNRQTQLRSLEFEVGKYVNEND
jgi:hypothetical protein